MLEPWLMIINTGLKHTDIHIYGVFHLLHLTTGQRWWLDWLTEKSLIWSASFHRSRIDETINIIVLNMNRILKDGAHAQNKTTPRILLLWKAKKQKTRKGLTEFPSHILALQKCHHEAQLQYLFIAQDNHRKYISVKYDMPSLTIKLKYRFIHRHLVY